MPLTAPDRRTLWWLLIAALGMVILHALGPVLTPFVLAAVLAYIFQPLVFWLGRRKVPRILAVVLVLLLEAVLLVLLLLTVVPLTIRQAIALSEWLPAVLDRLNETVSPWLRSKLDMEVALDAASLKEAVTEAIANSEGLGLRVWQSLRLGGLGLVGLFANLVLTPVVQFFLMRDWELILGRIAALIPPATRPRVGNFFREADAALAQYLRGQILLILIMTVFYTVGLWLTGLEFFLPIGVITGVLVFVPYVGAVTGFVLGTLAALLQFQDFTGIAWVWAVFVLGQTIEGNFLTPKIVGESIGLHPLAAIFALLAFGQIFGFTGLLIALPASAVLLVALRKLKAQYQQSALYDSGGQS